MSCWCGREMVRNVKDSNSSGTTMGLATCSGCGSVNGYCRCKALPNSPKDKQERRK